MGDEAKLEKLARDIRGCTACALHEGRNLAVPGEGPADARVFCVGEGPGADEDATGRPFIGRSGRFLDRFLPEHGVERSRLFITSTVKCRPPQNRDPKPVERETCAQRWLYRQIAVVDPQLVLLLGRVAAMQVLGHTGPLAAARGRDHWLDGRRYRVTVHPTAAMRFSKMREAFAEDLAAVRDVLQGEE